MFIRLQKQFAHWSMQMVKSLWVLSASILVQLCMESGACSKQCTCTVPLASFRRVIPSGAELNRHFAASCFGKRRQQTSRFEKNTNVLDCRRLPLFKPWRRCLRAFLGTGRQIRFTLFAAGFFHELGRSQQKIRGMFLQMRPLFQISTHLCHKAYESGLDFQFIFHLRFSRRLDSQLVTVYATMWQWLDRPHI